MLYLSFCNTTNTWILNHHSSLIGILISCSSYPQSRCQNFLGYWHCHAAPAVLYIMVPRTRNLLINATFWNLSDILVQSDEKILSVIIFEEQSEMCTKHALLKAEMRSEPCECSDLRSA